VVSKQFLCLLCSKLFLHSPNVHGLSSAQVQWFC
jgi:hypothetical protein